MEIILTQKVGIYNMTLFGWFFAFILFLSEIQAAWVLQSTKEDEEGIGYIFFMPAVGVVFRGIHCAGWFFTFPPSDEAILWRVSSAVLTGIAFLIPLLLVLLASLKTSRSHDRLELEQLAFYVLIIILLVYVVSRLFLLVMAFIFLRHLTPGMLALVKWTSFLPHI